MEQCVVRIENIKKNYSGRPVLKNINFELKPGEILGIIGGSGSGKTTFLHTMIGFLTPDGGDVKFRQRHLVAGGESSEDIYRSVYKRQREFKNVYGFAAQQPSFYEKLTIRENLEYFGQLYGLTKEALEANINTLLKLVNLDKSPNLLGKNLSGGMERRLDIACALIHNPDILILDEPTADLDPVLRKSIWSLIERINSKGTTVVLASHHLNELENLCSRIGIIMEGKIHKIGTPDELKKEYQKSNQIIIQSSPGNYSKVSKAITAKLKGKIESQNSEEGQLVIKTEKPQEVLNDLINIVEGKGEKILEMKLVKPSLDQVFISLTEDNK